MNLMVLIGGLVVIAAVVAYFMFGSSNDDSSDNNAKEETKKTGDVESIYEDIPIYFSSQTGTAERFSDLLQDDAAEFGVNTKVVALSDFVKEDFLKHKFCIFVLATHYEGDPPDNAVDWHENYLKAEVKEDLSHMKYVMYGLGDKTYKMFGGFARTVESEINSRGAKQVEEVIIGSDHNNDIETHYTEWKTGLFERIKDHLPEKVNVTEDMRVERKQSFDSARKQSGTVLIPQEEKFMVDFTNEKVMHSDNWSKNLEVENYELITGNNIKSLAAKVSKVTDLRQCNDTNAKGECLTRCLEIEIELPKGVKYQTAENLSVFPENNMENVDWVLQMLNLNGSEVINLIENANNKKTAKLPFPTPISVVNVVKKFMDLTGKLKPSVLKKLASYIKDENVRETLLKLTERNNQDFKNLQAKKWGLICVMKNYGVTGLSLDELIESTTRIPARHYTIASGSLGSPNKVNLCLALTISDVQPKPHYGLTSDYFNLMEEKTKRNEKFDIRVSFQKSTFHLPTVENTPCICISSGAGIAPFIGMLRDKIYSLDNCEDSNYGPLTFFYGFRNKNSDYLYSKEIQSAVSRGCIKNLFEAVSRDSESKKTYVQDVLKQNKQLVKDHLFGNGAIYVCGNLDMSNSVQAVIEECISEQLQISTFEAEKKCEEFKKERKICIEAWG